VVNSLLTACKWKMHKRTQSGRSCKGR
jgi:hypothetical protein